MSLTQLGTVSTSKMLEEDQGMIEQQKQIFGLFQHTIPRPAIPGFYASSTSDPVPPLAKMENEMDIYSLIMPLHGDNAILAQMMVAIALSMTLTTYLWRDRRQTLNPSHSSTAVATMKAQRRRGEDKEDKEDTEQYEKLSKCRFNGHGSGSPPYWFLVAFGRTTEKRVDVLRN
ncbi:hypothetical protein B0H14DRAFT_2643738 [Mycena olivaceomarginata]|nr:hypothetical protein B0H14DRAFT_2643738 [Mycena olivaceomarginata]